MQGTENRVLGASRRIFRQSVALRGSSMSVSADVKNVSPHAVAQDHLEMLDISEFAEADDGKGVLVLVYWVDGDKDERKWEPIHNVWLDDSGVSRNTPRNAPEHGLDLVGRARTKSSCDLNLDSLGACLSLERRFEFACPSEDIMFYLIKCGFKDNVG